MTIKELPGNIFSQPWWLDIVAPGEWLDIRVEKGGEIFARMPIVIRKKKGFSYIEMPVLTQKMGPWLKTTSEKPVTQHSNGSSLLKELIKKLPPFDFLNYNLSSEIGNYLPFLWEGFIQSSKISYILEYKQGTEVAWSQMKSSVRRDIRRAEEKLEISDKISTTDLYNLICKTFERKGNRPPYSFELLDQLYKKGEERGRAKIIGAVDHKGKAHAAQLYIYDDDTTYYLAGGFDPNSDIPGSVTLLIWNEIESSFSKDLNFDFEGSSIEPIEKFFSSFGAKQVHFHNIKGFSKRYAPIFYGKLLIRKLGK